MGHMMWGWPLPAWFNDNHIAMGLVQLLLAGIIMVINQKFFVSGFKSLWHRAPNFEQSLRSREFEPDGPNYTPRISGVMHVENGKFNYAMSILKSNNGNPDACNRYTFAYENAIAGEGHFIHTYKCDGNPLPSFEGEPKLVAIPDNMDDFAELLWNSLNEDNKVSLFVRYIDIETGKYESKIINKNK